MRIPEVNGSVRCTPGKALNLHKTEAAAKDAGHSAAKAANKAGKETEDAPKKTADEVEKSVKKVETQ